MYLECLGEESTPRPYGRLTRRLAATHTNIYRYICIYICVCVCLCLCVYKHHSDYFVRQITKLDDLIANIKAPVA